MNTLFLGYFNPFHQLVAEGGLFQRLTCSFLLSDLSCWGRGWKLQRAWEHGVLRPHGGQMDWGMIVFTTRIWLNCCVPVVEHWLQLAPMKNKGHSHCATFLHNKLYVCGGVRENGELNSVEVSASIYLHLRFTDLKLVSNSALDMALPQRCFSGKYCYLPRCITPRRTRGKGVFPLAYHHMKSSAWLWMVTYMVSIYTLFTFLHRDNSETLNSLLSIFHHRLTAYFWLLDIPSNIEVVLLVLLLIFLLFLWDFSSTFLPLYRESGVRPSSAIS